MRWPQHIVGTNSFRNSLLLISLLYFWDKLNQGTKEQCNDIFWKQTIHYAQSNDCRCGQIFEKFANIKRHIEILCRKGSGWTAALLWSYLCKRQTTKYRNFVCKKFDHSSWTFTHAYSGLNIKAINIATRWRCNLWIHKNETENLKYYYEIFANKKFYA